MTAPSPPLLIRIRRQRILPASPIAPGDTLKPRVLRIPAKPTPQTGSTFRRGAGGQTWLLFLRILNRQPTAQETAATLESMAGLDAEHAQLKAAWEAKEAEQKSAIEQAETVLQALVQRIRADG